MEERRMPVSDGLYRLEYKNCWCEIEKCQVGVRGGIEWQLEITGKQSIQKLIESGKYDTGENFTVVLQPFLRHMEVPILDNEHPDVSYFAPDCFHLSRKFHMQMSRSLWNNMLQPVGKKSDFQDLTANISLSCPTQDQPFLRTFKNSNYTYQGSDPSIKLPENWGSNLFCSENLTSETIPTSVHRLRPADINVVAAMGDSLTVSINFANDA
ncbi:phospholipase B1, membrane-associated [Rhincodon typus]|uniref:phospholipase B1, membrane-associated n=1 Tax=Rhincodon typus TaxID=259920 RepID=UPI00202F854A|nr:phospholipase B1, membrane-associated [Rhincodon typus]